MTEGPPDQNGKPMCVRIWLELGHACEPRRSLYGRSLALDWRVWVRGPSGQDISAIVHKVVFYLRPAAAFVYPKRVLLEPPYEIQESGCASIDIPIHVYLKHSTKPKRIKIKYSLQIKSNSSSNSESTCVYYDFENPTEEFKEALMRAGGEVLARVGRPYANKSQLVVLLSDTENKRKRKRHRSAIDYTETKKLKVTERSQCKQDLKRTLFTNDICSKCCASMNVDFRKILAPISMTDDEVKTVSHVYLSFSGYEKSANALILPPLSDPIYTVPELPVSLRGALASVESDYSM